MFICNLAVIRTTLRGVISLTLRSLYRQGKSLGANYIGNWGTGELSERSSLSEGCAEQTEFPASVLLH
jgi:hypothetical protein